MICRRIQKEDYEGIRQLLIDEGWKHQVKDTGRLQKLLERSSHSTVAIHENEVIGFARAVQIDDSNGYISMLAVAQDKRNMVAEARDKRLVMKQSIGYLLLECIREDNPSIKWTLRRGLSLLPPNKSQTL